MLYSVYLCVMLLYIVVKLVFPVLQLQLHLLLPPAHMMPVIYGIVEMETVFQQHIYVMVIMTVTITVMKIAALEVQAVPEVQQNQYQVSL